MQHLRDSEVEAGRKLAQIMDNCRDT